MINLESISWRVKSELWETQALGYWILGWLVEPTYSTVGYILMGYGTLTAIGVLYAMCRSAIAAHNATGE